MSDVQVLLDRAAGATRRVCADVRNAQLTWAHFEALRIETDPGAGLWSGANYLDLGYPLDALVVAVLRDTLAALMRATDDPRDKKLTLLRIRCALESGALREERMAAAEKWKESSFPALREKNSADCESSMQKIRDAVPTTWTDTSALKDQRLAVHRKSLWPLRNSSLALARPGDGNVATDDIRTFLKVVSELTAHAELIFLEEANNWEAERQRRLQEARAFWTQCQKGF